MLSEICGNVHLICTIENSFINIYVINPKCSTHLTAIMNLAIIVEYLPYINTVRRL